jgi:putative thioredoxin
MSQHVSEATGATFAQEVLERSKTTPVLVDFWAEWCGPCRVLGPVLEQAVEARGGAVWLVKVDTDTNQELAVQHGIRGIPAVKAFVGGRMVGEFIGVRDQRAVEAFIDQICPSEEEAALRRAEELLAGGKPEEVPPALRPALESKQHEDEARLLIARAHLARGAFDEADEALARVDDRSTVDEEQVQALQARSELLRAADGARPETLRQKVEGDPADHDVRWALAGALMREGQKQQALDELLELLQRAGRAFREDGARRAMLGIFDELGPDHELAREYRRKLQIYL